MSKISVLDMDSNYAEEFFIKGENYFNIDVPDYFEFDSLLQDIRKKLDEKKLSDFNKEQKAEELENVNYKIINNKDG